VIHVEYTNDDGMHIVACGPVVGNDSEREVNIQKPLLSNGLAKNMFQRQQLNYKKEERCFLCGPCRGIVSGTSLELQLVEISHSEE
jgi:hypothetical protein